MSINKECIDLKMYGLTERTFDKLEDEVEE